jgi:hypothetical protein
MMIYVKGPSGEVHRAFESEGILFTAEQCNVDQIPHKDRTFYYEVPSGEFNTCGACWPYAVAPAPTEGIDKME